MAKQLERAPSVDLDRWRFSAQDYLKLAGAGILKPEDRVELIDGEIIQMSPIGPTHASRVRDLTMILVPALQNRAIVSVQMPISLPSDSEPQPDITLLRPRADSYREAHPGPADVLLIIEAADSSLAYDKQIKLPLYSRHGVPETWIADLNGKQVLIHRDPTPDGYSSIRIARLGDSVSPIVFPDLTIAVADILG